MYCVILKLFLLSVFLFVLPVLLNIISRFCKAGYSLSEITALNKGLFLAVIDKGKAC